VLRASTAIGILFVSVVADAANSDDGAQWSATSTEDKCTLAGALKDEKGNAAGKIGIHWMRSGRYTLEISVAASAPLVSWRFDTTALNEGLAYQTGGYRYISIGGDSGERARREVAAGRSLNLIAGTNPRSHRLSTGTRGAPESLRAFDQCVAAFKALPEPPQPPPRWTASNQTGRSCSLDVADVIGVRGLHLGFGSRPKSPLTFGAGANTDLNKSRGILRIVLPGDPTPYTFDTGARSVNPDPRTPALYAAIKSLQPLDLVYTPPGAKPISTRTPTDGLAVASAMFDACATALRAESLPPRYQFNELRYIITEEENFCELTGIFQIDGNAIWVTLVGDGKKNVVKVTRRTVGAGYQIRVLGLDRLGGPKELTAQDGTFELDAKEFAAMRKDLIANGRDFQIVMSRDRSYTAQFGGALAVVEAPMFEACAHSKFDTR
jgi:hypothetical protein